MPHGLDHIPSGPLGHPNFCEIPDFSSMYADAAVKLSACTDASGIDLDDLPTLQARGEDEF